VVLFGDLPRARGRCLRPGKKGIHLFTKVRHLALRNLKLSALWSGFAGPNSPWCAHLFFQRQRPRQTLHGWTKSPPELRFTQGAAAGRRLLRFVQLPDRGLQMDGPSG
jgi:hypothetical protein